MTRRIAPLFCILALAGGAVVGCLQPSRTANSSTGSDPAQAAENTNSHSPQDDPALSDGTKATYVSLPKPENPLDAARAYDYLKKICALGSRTSGTPGMTAQQKLLSEHFQKLGGNVVMQRFQIRHPSTGEPVEIANMIVQWHPDRKERLLLSTHYDTRPLPDKDPNPRKRVQGKFIGANDGGSGTALLMELAHFMPKLESRYGVDFLLLDAEEFVYRDDSQIAKGDQYFVGSEYFAKDYVANPPAHRYRWGVLLDMIGDRRLQIFQEKNSMWWEDTRPLVEEIWGTARKLHVAEFIPRQKYEVKDDHLMLRNVGKIPTCDVIDFDYPQGPGGNYWHTEADTLDKCSGQSLAKVGWVLLEWMKTAR